MHQTACGNDIGYSVVHPYLCARCAGNQEGGGKPFVADVGVDVDGCTERGYTAEVLGCPVYPAGGMRDHYFYPHEWDYKNMKTWKVAGMIEDASFLVNFAHVKGHPCHGVWRGVQKYRPGMHGG